MYRHVWLCGNKQRGGFRPSVFTGGPGDLTPNLLTQPSFVEIKFPSPRGRIWRRLLVSLNSASLPHQPPLRYVTAKGDGLAPND